ncbi:MAG: hypothetical protein S4CHLAM37_04130 [Chlamydiia bacterium]|nr:hypothetical protein [Chlamydiia bacterium]
MTEFEIKKKNSMMVVGIELRTSNEPDAGPVEIPQHWEKFYKNNIMEKIPNKSANEVVALYCDYEGDHTKPYSLVIGCPVSSIDHIPEGMVAKIIPETSYAVFDVSGEFPKSLVETWGKIWRTKLDRTFSYDFELYGSEFGSTQKLDVYIAVK